ncbi:molybdopterin-synthase adenylyltransferase MoeB [Bauldia sp.]|uniref:molybdopterin-synthase adenylyltransferase MoeB n=1 Tax=Bauldia sp. TaxID=2575872 RepID=UPI003BAAEE16
MTLTSEETERYARHIVLAEVGGPGQAKLKAARVLIVGAGGLGTPVLQYLAAAGVGTIGIVDQDIVSLANLQRQVIHDTDAVGEPKTASAARSIGRINPHVTVETHPTTLTDANATALVAAYDVVADGSDTFATRYVASDACYLCQKPLVTAAVGMFDGSITTLKPWLRGADGRPNPTYRCLHPEPPPDDLLPTCAEAGILGGLTGVIGSIQAMEVIKEIVGFGTGLVGRVLHYDARAARFATFRYQWDPDNPLTGTQAENA